MVQDSEMTHFLLTLVLAHVSEGWLSVAWYLLAAVVAVGSALRERREKLSRRANQQRKPR